MLSEDLLKRLLASRLVPCEAKLAAIESWRRTPGDVWLGRVLGLPVLRQIARFGYDRFADLLYAWNRRNGRW